MQLISWATLQGSLELGIIYAIMALGVFISFRTLNMPDLTAGQEVYYQKSVGKDHSYIVIRRDAADGILKKSSAAGVETLPVKSDDLCVYLTTRNRGGIDDVFDRN
jgi:hypothetical protein